MQSKKRFTETNIWELNWFSNLTPKQKLFWLYINDKCDNIGVWEPNIGLAAYFLKIEIDTEIFMNNFLTSVNIQEERVIVLDNGLWFLPQFVKFQYCKSKPLNPNNSAHKSFIRQIDERNLSKWFLTNQPEVLLTNDELKESPRRGLIELSEGSNRGLIEVSESHKDKDKDMEKGKNKDMGKDKVKEADRGRDMEMYMGKVKAKEADEDRDIAMDNEFILNGITNNQHMLDDEVIDELGFTFDYPKSVERILAIWPNKSEVDNFIVSLKCEEILTDLIKVGLTFYDAEKTLKNEFKKAIVSEPSRSLEDQLEIIHNSYNSSLKVAV